MKIDICLKNAIDSLDLSSWEMRYGATALAIFLLHKIWNDESKEPGNMERYINRIESDNYGIYDDNLYEITSAISILYRTYSLRQFQRYGISNYFQKIDAGKIFTA